jgi:predicted NAD/FAD-dependent oxidoreductase
LIKCYTIPHSLPFHTPGKPLLAKELTEKGIYIAGDWRATPSQQGALLSGRLAAQAIISHL